MVVTSVGLLLFTVFFFLAAIHFYWGLGGKWGANTSFPTKENGTNVLNPKPLDCFVVAIGLLVSGIFILIKVQLILFELPVIISSYGLNLIGGIFIIRAIGEFKYVGFFKTIRNTPFGKLDTRYYSPLCLFIGLMALILDSSISF